jgi:hypothetical protein
LILTLLRLFSSLEHLQLRGAAFVLCNHYFPIMGNAQGGLGTQFDAKLAKTIFAQIDADGSGTLSHEELSEGIQQLGIADNWPEKKLLRFIGKFDINGALPDVPLTYQLLLRGVGRPAFLLHQNLRSCLFVAFNLLNFACLCTIIPILRTDDGELDFGEFKKLCKNICKRNRQAEAKAEAAAEPDEEAVAPSPPPVLEAAPAPAVAAERPASSYSGFGEGEQAGEEGNGADEIYEPMETQDNAPPAGGETVFAEMPTTYADPERNSPVTVPEADEEESEAFPDGFAETEEPLFKRRGSQLHGHEDSSGPSTIVVKTPLGDKVGQAKAKSDAAEAALLVKATLQGKQALKVSGEIATVKGALDKKENSKDYVPPTDKQTQQKRKASVRVKDAVPSVTTSAYVAPVRGPADKTGAVSAGHAMAKEEIQKKVAKPEMQATKAIKPSGKIQELRANVALGNAEGSTHGVNQSSNVLGLAAEEKAAHKAKFDADANQIIADKAAMIEKIGEGSKFGSKTGIASVVGKKITVDKAAAKIRAEEEQDYQAFMVEQLAAAKLQKETDENEERGRLVNERRAALQTAAAATAATAASEAAAAAAVEAAAAANAAAIAAAHEARLDAAKANQALHDYDVDSIENGLRELRGAKQGHPTIDNE